MDGVNDNVANVLFHVHSEPIEGVVTDLQAELHVDNTLQFAYCITATHQFAAVRAVVTFSVQPVVVRTLTALGRFIRWLKIFNIY